jgi:hypothetical protein
MEKNIFWKIKSRIFRKKKRIYISKKFWNVQKCYKSDGKSGGEMSWKCTQRDIFNSRNKRRMLSKKFKVSLKNWK